MNSNKTYSVDEMKKLHYKEYKKIGGKNNFKEYSKNYDVFFEHTYDIFIFGDTTKYNSRDESIKAVKKILKITWKEIHLIFHSIDRVTSYT
uniref:ORF28 n=1 Tax=Nitrosopumilaceae spindle-shaped virus TaxID=3065433 RepID=A0AAT9J7L5_9VIRU